MTKPIWQRPGILLTVGAGGMLGTAARYELAVAIPEHRGAFPLSTFLINVTGSFVLGIVLTLLVQRWRPHEYVRPLLATGLIGAYTTWSTFMVDADELVKAGHAALAAGYVLASLAAGLGALYAGMLLSRVRLPAYRQENS